MDTYNTKIQEWTDVQEERKHTFTITEKDLEETTKKQGKTQNELSKGSEGDLKKFFALPPIGSSRRTDRARSGNENVKPSPVPVAPSSFLLHLSVTAQTLEIEDAVFDKDILDITTALMR